MNARIWFTLLSIASLVAFTLAMASPQASDLRAKMPMSAGSADAPVYVAFFGNASAALRDNISADVEAGITRVTYVEAGSARTGCLANGSNCTGHEPVPARYNAANIEPLTLIGSDPARAASYTDPERARLAYERAKLRVGR